MRNGPLTGSLPLLCCENHLSITSSTWLHSVFPKSLYSRSVPFKRTNNFGFLSPHRMDSRICETKFPTHVTFCLSILYFSYYFKFSFDAQPLPTLPPPSVIVVMLSHYYSTVNCTSRKIENNYMRKVNYRWDFRCSGMIRGVDWWLQAFRDNLSHLQGSRSPGYVSNYQSTLHNIPQERRSHSQHGRSLKLRIAITFFVFHAWNLYRYLKDERTYLLKDEERAFFSK
jgi:hypothetical protein